jgi:hypothetical protein
MAGPTLLKAIPLLPNPLKKCKLYFYALSRPEGSALTITMKKVLGIIRRNRKKLLTVPCPV